ncbi:MAG: M48 family metalloprotease [Burkholderiales bacterium]|nr:M48 family metalloprotease [Phycisphaerae bacterium]
MNRKTIIMMAVTVVSAMSLGSSCDQMAGSIGRGVGMSGGGGGTDTAGLIQAGAKGVQAMGTFDPGEQELMGQTIAVSLASSPGLVEEEKLNAYVTKVGLTIVSVCGRSDIDFTFGVLNDSNVNAISAPRGYVFVTRGALAQAKDEAELAGVLAHEIAHVVKDHGVETVRNDKLLDAGLTGAAAAAKDPWLATGANLANRWKGVLYNPGQERDADQLAVKYLKAAGYDPNGLSRFLERTGAGRDKQFSSHPPTSDRVAKLQSLAGPNPPGQRLPERYAASVKIP